MRAGRESDVDAEEGGPAFDLADVLRALRRRKWMILALTVASALAAAMIAAALPNRYEAVASVQIDQRQKRVVAIDGVVSDLKADAATVESEVEVIRSHAILLRVIEELRLRDDPEFAAPTGLQALWERLGGRPATPAGPSQAVLGATPALKPPAAALPQRDAVLVALESRLKVQRLRMTLLIEVRFSSADPVKAARIANAIADTYIRVQVEAKQRATEAATAMLDERIRALTGKVADADRAVERFKAENNIFDADGMLLGDRQLAREMETLVKLRNEAAEAKARYEQARRMMLLGEGNESAVEVLKSHAVRLLRDELAKALRRQAELATKYGPLHPEMQRIGADIAKAQAELNGEVGKITRSFKQEHEIAQARVLELELALEDLKRQIAASKETQWRLRELEREAAANRQLLETMLQRAKQTAETVGLQLPDSRLVEHAIVPLQPAGPKRKQMVAIAAAVGLMAGLALTFVLDLAGAGLRRPEEVELVADAPVLGLVPEMGGPHGLAADPLRAVRSMLADPSSGIAEAIRGVQHELDRRRQAPGPVVIEVVSALPGEGTSIVAGNLALHYALQGRRTLLVDADMRRRNLTRVLDLAARPGLVEVLGDGAMPAAVVLRDGVSGLAVLPAGGLELTGPSAAGLLARSRFAHALAALRHDFDVIVIDVPPMMPVVDARIVADHADDILFVTTWRRTPKAVIRRALQVLGPNREKVRGVLVNRVDDGSASHATAALAPALPVERTVERPVDRHAA